MSITLYLISANGPNRDFTITPGDPPRVVLWPNLSPCTIYKLMKDSKGRCPNTAYLIPEPQACAITIRWPIEPWALQKWATSFLCMVESRIVKMRGWKGQNSRTFEKVQRSGRSMSVYCFTIYLIIIIIIIIIITIIVIIIMIIIIIKHATSIKKTHSSEDSVTLDLENRWQ